MFHSVKSKHVAECGTHPLKMGEARIRPLPEGGLLWFVHVLFLYLVQSKKSQHIESALG